MIKAVFFDIDGTLVPFGEPLMPLETVAALDALRARGVKVFISSGRPKYLITNLRDYPFDGYVCCNGGLVYLGNGVIFSKPLARDDVRAVVEVCDREHIGCVAFGEDRMKLNFRSPISERVSEQLHVQLSYVGDLHEFIDNNTIYQFTVYAGEDVERELLAPAVKRTIFPRWHPDFMDVTPDNTSKAEGIAKIAARCGWGMDELMAFGDGGNDISMLRAVGVGVAMGNAVDEVKSAANYVTADTREGGIVAALIHYNLIDE